MIYISGSISNDPDYKQKFKKAENYLSDNFPGIIINPIEHAEMNFDVKNTSWHDFMIFDLNLLKKCNKIYMLNDWKESVGATIEHMWAEKLGLEIIYEKGVDNAS